MCLNWNVPEEAGFQEHFPEARLESPGRIEGIVLHFRLHLGLTWLAVLKATCPSGKTPARSQDKPGLKLQVRKFRPVALHLGRPQFLHSEDGYSTIHMGLLKD